MRVWFPNLPSSGINEADRSQKAIGVSRAVLSNVDSDYFRRYLDDPEQVVAIGIPVVENVVSENADTTYLRRYLDDPIP